MPFSLWQVLRIEKGWWKHGHVDDKQYLMSTVISIRDICWMMTRLTNTLSSLVQGVRQPRTPGCCCCCCLLALNTEAGCWKAFRNPGSGALKNKVNHPLTYKILIGWIISKKFFFFFTNFRVTRYQRNEGTLLHLQKRLVQQRPRWVGGGHNS